jgi:hypothetical protein
MVWRGFTGQANLIKSFPQNGAENFASPEKSAEKSGICGTKNNVSI